MNADDDEPILLLGCRPAQSRRGKKSSRGVALAIDGVAPERQRHFITRALDLVQT